MSTANLIEAYQAFGQQVNLPADDLRTAAMFAAHQERRGQKPTPAEWMDLVDYVSPDVPSTVCPVRWDRPEGRGTAPV